MSDSTSGTSGHAGAPSDKSLTDAIEAALSSDAAAASHIESPSLVPEPNAAAPKPNPAKNDAPAMAGKLMIMAPSPRRDWSDMRIEPETVIEHEAEATKAGGFKFPAMAAMIALAAVAGAIGGAGATAGLSWGWRSPEPVASVMQVRALDDTIMRIEADLASLKTNVDKVSRANITLASKATDRFDKLEKAQADPAARIAKLTETVEKLRVAAATPPPAPAPTPAPVPVAAAPAREVTGSIQTQPAATPPKSEKPELARLPIVEGWVLRDVERGAAMIEGRPGIFEVIAGDPVPGLGRVDAIRRQDGRWVVVTSKGLIVGR